MTTLPPSLLERTPRSCGFGLDALPLFFEKNPSIPEGFDFTGADLSARSDHEPVSSNVTDTPPLADWFLTPCLAFTPAVGGLAGVGRSGAVTVFSNICGDDEIPLSPLHFVGIGGDPEVGDPTVDFWLFDVAFIETGLPVPPVTHPVGRFEGFTQSGGGPTD